MYEPMILRNVDHARCPSCRCHLCMSTCRSDLSDGPFSVGSLERTGPPPVLPPGTVTRDVLGVSPTVVDALREVIPSVTHPSETAPFIIAKEEKEEATCGGGRRDKVR